MRLLAGIFDGCFCGQKAPSSEGKFSKDGDIEPAFSAIVERTLTARERATILTLSPCVAWRGSQLARKSGTKRHVRRLTGYRIVQRKFGAKTNGTPLSGPGGMLI